MEELDEKLHLQLLNIGADKRNEWMRERKPFSVLFELTSLCNMNCIHCYLQNSHSPHMMSFQQITDIIDILYEKGILFITFTGGEILTRKDFVDIYMYAKKRGFLVELFTNGYLFTDEIIKVLQAYPPLLVDISLYGANEETYKKITGIDGAFIKVVENCRKLTSAGVRVSLKSPIIKETLDEIEKMKQLANEIGVPFVYSFEICPTIDKKTSPKSHQVDLKFILDDEFKNYFEQIKRGDRVEGQINYEFIDKLAKSENIFACNVGLNSFMIDYSGRMCPCMKLRHKGQALTRDNYDAIWESFKSFSTLRASQEYKCMRCKSRYYCDVCPGEIEHMYGDYEYRNDSMCRPAELRRRFYEKLLTFEDVIKKASFDE